MKKFVLFTLLTLTACGWLSAQTFSITAPKAGETWKLGSPGVVAWTYSGFPAGTQVKLVLYQNGQIKGPLTTGTTIGANGSGSWTWADVGSYNGGKALEGGNYKIRIRDVQGAYPFKESGLFSLAKEGSNYDFIALDQVASQFRTINRIQVSMPVQGLQAKPGDMLEIKWDKTPIASYAQVKFGVYLPDLKTYIGPVHKTDASPKPNTGDYQDAYVLYERYQVGKEYVIRVATPDDKFYGFSGVFRVIPLEAVPLTETFTGSHSIAYRTIDKSNWPGCLYTHGEAPNYPSSGYAVGWENDMQDPAGPCWKYIGHIYRTVVAPSGIYQGYEVTKALLRFSVISGTKQAFHVLRRDDAADWGKTTPVTTVASWGFGSPIEVDITPLVQAWCTGQVPNHGLVIRGGNENYDHDNTMAQCVISAPELVITRTTYK